MKSSQSNRNVWSLIGETEESGPTRKIAINATPFQVGRRADLPLSLSCLSVSKLHAELIQDGPYRYVRDLKSTNGTYINGQRIRDEKALEDGDLLQFGNLVFQVYGEEPPAATDTVTAEGLGRAKQIRQFQQLMKDRAVLAHFQPIVDLNSGRTVGYEVLGRSLFSSLETPHAMFRAAAMLNAEAELSRILRREGMQASINLPGKVALFLNVHPLELEEPGLLESLAETRRLKPDLPITLEIHEATVTNPASMVELRAALRDLQVHLAYDDFGAGQSRLLELFAVPPDYVKFDLNLVQGISRVSDRSQQMLSTLVSMVRDAGAIPLAEGVECDEDGAACAQLGFELAQGYHFGRPALAVDFAAFPGVLADASASATP